MITSAQKLLMARAGVSAGGGEPWYLDSAVYLQSFAVPSGKGGTWFKPDGSKLYTASAALGASSRSIDEFDLSTNWDISTATLNQRFVVATQERDVNQVAFDPTGAIMYICGKLNDMVQQYTLSTAWDVSTATHDGSGPSGYSNPSFFLKGDDGTKLYHTSSSGNTFEFPLSTAWDVTTYGSGTDLGAAWRYAKPDGTMVYNQTNGDGTKTLVGHYLLSTAWDFSSGTLTSTLDTFTETSSSMSMHFISPDGKNLYVTSGFTGAIFQYKLA
jgi:hypothetical protein